MKINSGFKHRNGIVYVFKDDEFKRFTYDSKDKNAFTHKGLPEYPRKTATWFFNCRNQLIYSFDTKMQSSKILIISVFLLYFLIL